MATSEGEDSRHDFNVVSEYRSAYQAVIEASASTQIDDHEKATVATAPSSIVKTTQEKRSTVAIPKLDRRKLLVRYNRLTIRQPIRQSVRGSSSQHDIPPTSRDATNPLDICRQYSRDLVPAINSTNHHSGPTDDECSSTSHGIISDDWRPTNLDGFTDILDSYNIHIFNNMYCSSEDFRNSMQWWREEKLRYEKAATDMAKRRASCAANSGEDLKSNLNRALNDHAIHDAASPFLYFLGSAYRANIAPSPVAKTEESLYAETAIRKAVPISTHYQTARGGRYISFGILTAVDQSSLESDHSSPSNLLRQPPGHLDWAYQVRIPASNAFYICEIGYHVFISWYDDMTPCLSVVMDDLEDSTTSDEQRAHYVLFKIVVIHAL
ncbi:hypothetical protein OIDMADRAFT_58840 [Oidiodendron maius Zn]|uniref:Uncharacterized protein n=1 Tax=Oidiodendron maius (strain Zn) TaxID=913774 RepID=A0A0C3H1X7_OIDMZ|nr:hypothetical protein OIDMADRAFT_58840 [Oidiodendron maius Zn]